MVIILAANIRPDKSAKSSNHACFSNISSCSHFSLSLSAAALCQLLIHKFAKSCLTCTRRRAVGRGRSGRGRRRATWNRRRRHAYIAQAEKLAKKFAKWLARVSCPPDQTPHCAPPLLLLLSGCYRKNEHLLSDWRTPCLPASRRSWFFLLGIAHARLT